MVVSLLSVMICGGGTQSEFCKARVDQNRSTITCVRRGVCFVQCKIVFVPSSIKMHQYMKKWKGSMLRNTRLQRNEYQGIKMKWTIMERLEMFTSWQRQVWRNALSRSKKLYVGKFYRMDSLSCGSKGKSSSASIILGILNKIRTKCTVRFHHDSVPGHLQSSSPASPFAKMCVDSLHILSCFATIARNPKSLFGSTCSRLPVITKREWKFTTNLFVIKNHRTPLYFLKISRVEIR